MNQNNILENNEIIEVMLTITEIIENNLEDDLMNESLETGVSGEKGQKEYKYLMKTMTVSHLSDGTPVRKKVYGKTEEELNRKYEEMYNKYKGPKAKRMTAKEWLPEWSEVYLGTHSRQYRDEQVGMIKKHIIVPLGDMCMSDVSDPDLQRIMNTFQHGNKKSVEKIMQAIKKFFRDAKKKGIVDNNPALELVMPKKMYTKKTRVLTETEQKIIVKAIANHKYGPFMEILRYTGLRSGELAAIMKADVDLDGKRIHVKDSVSYDDDYNPVLSGSTKGDKIRGELTTDDDEIVPRVVPIPNILLPTMIKLCEGKNDDDLLFPWNGGCLGGGTRYSWWLSFRRQCYIEAGAERSKRGKVIPDSALFNDDISIRNFRKTYGTNLRDAGIDKTGREDFLGHKRTDVNDIYTDFSEPDFQRNSKKLNAFFDGGLYVDDDVVENTKPEDIKTITTIIDTSLLLELINVSIKQHISLDDIYTNAVQGFVTMYETNLKGTSMVNAIVPASLSESFKTIDISSEEKLFNSMDAIASDRGASSVEMYQYAIKWYLDKVKSCS